MKFVFVADAACDVSEEDKKRYNINIIPIELNFGDEIYPTGLSNEEYYEKLKNSSIMPKTAMPNAYKFQTFYKDYVNKEDVFVITILISMELSATKVQAQNAAEELGMKNVFIEESQAATVAQGALIVELAKYCQNENDIEKIIRIIPIKDNDKFKSNKLELGIITINLSKIKSPDGTLLYKNIFKTSKLPT